MNDQRSTLEAGARLLSADGLDDTMARAFGPQRLAEITHLPAGIASAQIEVLNVAPGGRTERQTVHGEDAVVHVIAGTAFVLWGPALAGETPAGAGDTVLIPAGVPFVAQNAGVSAALQLILVRGG